MIQFTEDRSGNRADTAYRVWVEGEEDSLAAFASIDRAIRYIEVLEVKGYDRDPKLLEKFDEWQTIQFQQFGRY